MRPKLIGVCAFLMAMAVPAVAQAHVSLHPNEVPTGAFATLDIRVPNEETSANTTKVTVQMPPGFTDASTGYLPGWTAKVETKKLAKAITTDAGTQTQEVSQITWTGDGNLGKIPPSSFLNLPISVVIPGKAGDTLTFKTLQTYDNGKVVRWIGNGSSDTPAPTVRVTGAGGALQDVAGSETGPPSGQAASSGGSNGASKGLAITALVAGALGLLAGGTALVRGRRS